MRRLLWVLAFLLAVTGAGASLSVSGDVCTQQVWSDTVYVTGDVTVRDGVLGIRAGTVVIFMPSNDNRVYGDSSHIWIVVTDSGAIDARGYEEQRISFTSTARKPGSWGGIRFAGLQNDAANYLIHCDIEYAVEGVSVENVLGVSESSSPNISYCAVRHCSRYGIYGNEGAAPQIRSCVIHNAGTGIFLHKAGEVDISETYLYNLGSGIVVYGGSGAYPNISIDHVTVNAISSEYDSLPLWWRGYAFYCTNTSGSVSLTNSIIASTDKGIKLNNWDFEGAYNYWCVTERALPESLYDTGSMSCGDQANLFVDADNGDLRLNLDARPRDAASDGSNMGAWQEWHEWPYEPVSSFRDADVTVTTNTARFGVSPNPAAGTMTFVLPSCGSAGSIAIYDRLGRLHRVLSVSAGGSGVRWDGRDGNGMRVAPGMYVCRLQAGALKYETSVLIVR